MPSLEDARILQPVTAATLDTLDLFYVYGAGVNDPLKLTVPEFRKTLFNVVGEAPTNLVAAAVTIDPTGSNNSITWTAIAPGAAGNDITVTYTTPADENVQATEDGTDVTVACGTKARMIVSGSLTPNAAGTLYHMGSINGHPAWSSDGSAEPPESGNWVLLFKPGSVWTLAYYTDGIGDSSWAASDDNAFPAGLTYVASDDETGTPVVAAALPTAQQVIDSCGELTLVTPTASGTVTGAVAAVSQTSLTGGTDATTASSFVIATTTTLYVNVGTYAAPVWKEAALSALS